jgi:hypothetical protein
MLSIGLRADLLQTYANNLKQIIREIRKKNE